MPLSLHVTIYTMMMPSPRGPVIGRWHRRYGRSPLYETIAAGSHCGKTATESLARLPFVQASWLHFGIQMAVDGGFT
jgi:hypothetical protein